MNMPTQPVDPRSRLKEVRTKIRLLEAENQLRRIEMKSKRIQEQDYLWNWVGGYQDLLDRLRSPDGALLQSVSVASDRLYGANWPFWKTWQDHSFLRGAARILCATNNQAKGAVNGLTNYVIDKGFTWKARDKKDRNVPEGITQAVQLVIDDVMEVNGWNELERELFARTIRDGESFLRIFPDESTGVSEVRTCEPEQIVENSSQFPIEIGSFGIINAPHDIQKHIAYNYSPTGGVGDSEEVPASEMIHIKINTDRAVKRGMPDFSFDTYDMTKSAGRLLGNMAEGSAIQASIALIRQHEASVPSDVQGFIDAEADYQIPDPWSGSTRDVSRAMKGSTLDIGKGFEYIQPPYSQGAAAHAQVASMIMRSVAARWNAPEWLISGDASNNNYSSSLTAESPFVKNCKSAQHFYGGKFKRVIVQAVRIKAEMGLLRWKGHTYTWEEVRYYVDIDFEPPTVETRDKLQEAQTFAVELQSKVTSPQIWAAKIGNDWDQVSADLDEINDRFGQEGPPLPLPGEKPPGESEAQEQALLEEWDENKHKRANDGKFGSGGGSNAASKPAAKPDSPETKHPPELVAKAKAILQKSGKLVGAAEHWVTHKIEENVNKLPPKAQAIVKGAYRVAMLSYNTAWGLVEKSATASGMSPDSVKKLATTLAAADLLGAKATVVALEMLHVGTLGVTAGGFVPVASCLYLGYSLAKNPQATMKAASHIMSIVKGSLKGKAAHESIQPDTITRLIDVTKDYEGAQLDWFLALLSAALDQTGDLSEAIDAAQEAIEKHPESPEE